MSGTETAKLWAQRLRRFDQAEMTVAMFCASEGVSQPSFYNWKRKLRRPAVTAKRNPPASFLPVKLPQPVDSASAIVTTIELPGGIRIRVETPGDQAATTPRVATANLEASR